jgi:thimet oligopeptidase
MSLLKHSDVTIFFHEFGHAMHNLLGRTELSGFAGTNTKHDFVEVPSQMFEEWMWNKKMLKQITSHYKTQLPLPDNLMDKMLELKRFDSGWYVQRQCYLSLLSLALYKEGANKNIDQINQDLFSSIIPHISFDPSLHMYTSFGHLTDYAAKYYCYMWSKVIALDFFKNVCEKGLLNGSIGSDVVSKVLSLGGSVDPDILCRNLLRRASTNKAFLSDLGLNI